MKKYRLDPAKLKQQNRNIYLMYGITLVLLLILNFFMYRGRADTKSPLLTLGLIVVMFVLVGWNAVRQRKAIWDQYELIVDETGITQKQPKAADMFLPRAEITGMKETKYGFTLMVKDQHPVMGIPKMLTPADYEEIKGIVDGWLKNAQPVVLDVEVIEDAQVIEPGVQKEVVSEVLPAEEPENQEPPATPEA
jgi:hypothetical protein